MRAIINLTDEVKKELKQRKKSENNKKIYRRYLYLEMSNKGLTNLEIASILGVTNDTLTDWRRIFLKHGLIGISNLNYEGRKESMLKPYESEMKKQVEDGKITILKDLWNFLKDKYDIEVEISWLFRYCKKNSIYPIKKQD